MSVVPGTVAASHDWRLCLAPMMDRTDRHFRYLVRLLAPRMRLYTEMITTGAILFGNHERFLEYHPAEHPVALQLGGSDPDDLARATALAVEYGYDEVNLNCGCPSDRVQSGAFGACLMREPGTVAAALAAMRDAAGSTCAVSVKTRLGVDELYAYDYFRDFVGRVAESGCTIFHVHARKAWLSGLSPRENREIPPLEYDWVYRLKREFPGLVVVINGGIESVSAAQTHWQHTDGVMIGRQAYRSPESLVDLHRAAFPQFELQFDADEVIARYVAYAHAEHAGGVPMRPLSRHLVNLFRARPGARLWRRALSAGDADAGPALIEQAYRSLAAGHVPQSGVAL